ncbi:MAG TPA: hypothetical protein VF009_10615 [Solirubrobacterales bacterium]
MHGKLTFKRFVLITARVKDASADEVEPTISRSRAEAALGAPFGGADDLILYSEPVEQAARCCAAIIRERPLTCDNKHVAWDCMLEMLARLPWAPIDPAPKTIGAKLDELGDETIDEDDFVRWVRKEVGRAEVLRYERRREIRA